MATKKNKKNKPKKSAPAKKNKFYGYFLGALVLSLLVFSAGVYFLSSSGGNYEKLKTVSSGSNRYELSLPQEMTELESGKDIIDYQEQQSGGGGILSHIRVEPQFIDENLSKATKEEIFKQFKSKEGEYYNVFQKNLNSGPLANELKFDDFYDYKSANIERAIVAEFSYLSDSVPTKGRLFIAFDNQYMYFFIAEATNVVWDDNLDIWNEVFKSFKLNN